MSSPTENRRVQGLFKALKDFQVLFMADLNNLQGLFKQAIRIQVRFKPVRTMLQFSYFQINQAAYDNTFKVLPPNILEENAPLPGVSDPLILFVVLELVLMFFKN